MRVTLRSCFSCALEMNVSSWNRAVFWSAIKEEACYVDSDLHAHSLQRGAPCERTATVKEMERNEKAGRMKSGSAHTKLGHERDTVNLNL